MLKVGDLAPMDVKVKNLQDKDATLSDYALTDYLLVYFYPKDDTPGCTTQACDLRDYNKDIMGLGVTIVGVSKDGVKSHNKFKEKHSLNFELLSDEEHRLMEAFGTWQEKKFMGKAYMGTSRSTFLLDKQGKVLYVWESAKPLGHGKDVYQVVKGLS